MAGVVGQRSPTWLVGLQLASQRLRVTVDWRPWPERGRQRSSSRHRQPLSGWVWQQRWWWRARGARGRLGGGKYLRAQQAAGTAACQRQESSSTECLTHSGFVRQPQAWQLGVFVAASVPISWLSMTDFDLDAARLQVIARHRAPRKPVVATELRPLLQPAPLRHALRGSSLRAHARAQRRLSVMRFVTYAREAATVAEATTDGRRGG